MKKYCIMLFIKAAIYPKEFFKAMYCLIIVFSLFSCSSGEISPQRKKPDNQAFDKPKSEFMFIAKVIETKPFVDSRVLRNLPDRNIDYDSLISVYDKKLFINITQYSSSNWFKIDRSNYKEHVNSLLSNEKLFKLKFGKDTLLPSVSYLVEDGNVREFIEYDLIFDTAFSDIEKDTLVVLFNDRNRELMQIKLSQFEN